MTDGDIENREVSWESFARFIPSITREEFADLVSWIESRTFPAGTVLSNEKERASYIGFLLTGKLSVRKTNKFSGRPALLAILEEGAIFGERNLAEGLPADVSLETMEESRALLLPCDKVRQVIRDNPALGVKILSSCLKVVGRRLQGATARIVDIL
ncbi:MAG: Crp/Fnr family transcriptional regulator [Desulfurivibrionaceae bacterium]